ncbi:hypothetical protein H257_16502 [Aphanomyces astaci]|uniref:Peptidase A2 domain-containing protein n=1 Tax=Aphanomyces astaci TaxID=112090 RepID=W4FKL7_APHAT|nr:hypothetical protein H257_16502 [Aphanomyces astaci]ETV67263.1 hypothetical protein H257_16502 [Aphanomyces astaci]|eukprot:XP_009843251.1 hypothetical protein H257_16502 [Aphanomyces astaci]
MEDTSPGVVRDSTTIEPWNAPGLGDDTKNGMASRPPQTKGIPGSAYKDMQEEGRIQERPEDRLQTEARMLPPSDKRHGPSAQPRPVPLPEDSTVSAGEGETIGAPGAKATLQQQTDVARGGDEAPGRNKTIGETSGTTGVYTGPSAGDDSRRQTDGSEDKEEKGMYAEPSKEEKSIKTNGETSGTTGVYTGPSAGDDSRRQTVGSEDKEEKGMYAEPSKEESSCRQTEPNTRDASALPDGDFLAPRGAASVLSRTQPRVRGTLATFPEETDNAREPGDPSRDSTNPGDLRPDSDITPVFTAAQIEAISRGDMTGLPDSRHVDIEERLYPLTPADLELQLKALRSQRRTPPGDHPGSPGGYRTPRLLCGWPGSPKETGLDGGSYPTALTHLEGTSSNSDLSATLPRVRNRRTRPGSAVIDPDIPPLLHESEAPDRRHDPSVQEDSTRLEVAGLEVRETIRCMDWPFQGLDESGFTALLHSRTRDPYPLCGVMTGSLAPLVLATIDGHITQALVDTGALVTVISQEFWMLLGRPPLRTPSYGLVSAANAGISTLGFRHCSVTLAGISTTFPVWVLEDSVTPCILGVNLLRTLHALVDLGRDQVCFEGNRVTLPFITPGEHDLPRQDRTVAHLRRKDENTPGAPLQRGQTRVEDRPTLP